MNNNKTAKEIKALNVRVREVLAPTYFESIPLEGINEILQSEGLALIQEDNTRWSGFLMGSDSRALIEIGKENGSEVLDSTKNALMISWYKMNSGRWEVIGYIA